MRTREQKNEYAKAYYQKLKNDPERYAKHLANARYRYQRSSEIKAQCSSYAKRRYAELAPKPLAVIRVYRAVDGDEYFSVRRNNETKKYAKEEMQKIWEELFI